MAEAQGKALLTINAGEIGTDFDKVRRWLSSLLRLAQRSGAIVLVPSADRYMQRAPVDVGITGDIRSGEAFTHQL